MATGPNGEPGRLAARHVAKAAEVVSGLVRVRPLGVVERIVLDSPPSVNCAASVLAQQVSE